MTHDRPTVFTSYVRGTSPARWQVRSFIRAADGGFGTVRYGTFVRTFPESIDAFDAVHRRLGTFETPDACRAAILSHPAIGPATRRRVLESLAGVDLPVLAWRAVAERRFAGLVGADLEALVTALRRAVPTPEVTALLLRLDAMRRMAAGEPLHSEGWRWRYEHPAGCPLLKWAGDARRGPKSAWALAHELRGAN